MPILFIGLTFLSLIPSGKMFHLLMRIWRLFSIPLVARGSQKGLFSLHRNMVTGASSVAEYLNNTDKDRLLCVLPFSFDYGFSQLSTTFLVGGSCYLLEYLLPKDIITAVDQQKITRFGSGSFALDSSCRFTLE